MSDNFGPVVYSPDQRPLYIDPAVDPEGFKAAYRDAALLLVTRKEPRRVAGVSREYDDDALVNAVLATTRETEGDFDLEHGAAAHERAAAALAETVPPVVTIIPLSDRVVQNDTSQHELLERFSQYDGYFVDRNGVIVAVVKGNNANEAFAKFHDLEPYVDHTGYQLHAGPRAIEEFHLSLGQATPLTTSRKYSDIVFFADAVGIKPDNSDLTQYKLLMIKDDTGNVVAASKNDDRTAFASSFQDLNLDDVIKNMHHIEPAPKSKWAGNRVQEPSGELRRRRPAGDLSQGPISGPGQNPG